MTRGAMWLRRFARDEAGATMTEYGIMLVLIAAVCIAIVTTIGGQVQQEFQGTSDLLP
ncbi:MAG TPA: Flp family type IVb pilin [Gemmatimonadaceae bacterium]